VAVSAAPKVLELVENGIEETLAYYQFPSEHWRRNPNEQSTRTHPARNPAMDVLKDQ
jgi:hypothetical protein